MTLQEFVLTERRAGFARFAGTRAVIVLPVRQAVIDEVLPLLPGLPQGLVVTLAPDQRVRVQLAAFQATVYVHPHVELEPTPTLRLELASQLVAFGLRMVSLPPFVQVIGREIRVNLAAIPALAEASDLWPAIERISFTGGPDAWEIAVHLHIAATSAPPGSPVPRPRTTTTADAQQPTPALVTWARRQWHAGLPALAGARVTAHLRASVDVLNDWLGEALRQLATGGVKVPGDTGTPDMSRLVGFVRHVRLDAAPGVVTLDVEAGVGG